MKTQEGQYFFKPRVFSDKYGKGWEGYRTLVLGVFHVCTYVDCPYRTECLSDTSKYDSQCPSYVGKDEYYRLSNSNEIEVESYLEEAARYPTYTAVTKYLLNTNRHSSEDEKRGLWDTIAFTNFLQNFRGGYDTLNYEDCKELFDKELPAFVKVLGELKPEVIYVIDTAVTDCLKAHIDDIPGLRYIDDDQNWTLPIFRFTYNVRPKDTPEKILRSFKSLSKVTAGSADVYGRVLKALNDAKDRAKLKNPSRTVIEALPHIWDEQFESYLFRKQIDSVLSPAQKAALAKILNNLDEKGYPHNFTLKYERDGILVEMINYLDSLKENGSRIDPFYFVRAMGVQCSSREEWRTIRKKDYQKHKHCHKRIKELILEAAK